VEALDAIVVAARRAWPNVAWSEDRVRELLAGTEGGTPGATEPVERSWDELLLAWACVLGDTDALRAIERRYIADVIPNLQRLRLSSEQVDEVLQQLRARLLIGSEQGPPRLSRYSGRGHLGGFVRTIAVRLALDLQRSRGATGRDDVGELMELAGQDPELAYMRRLYADKVEQALRVAWARLSAEQRVLLRQQALDGLHIDQLAVLYSIHRSSAARRCAAARAALLTQMRRELKARLGVGGKTLESILQLFTSGLDAHLEEAAG